MAKRSKSWSKWTSAVVEEFKVDYPYMSWDELLEKYPFQKSSLVAKASELKIKRKVGAVDYTEEDTKILIDAFNNGASDEEIAKTLSRTVESIKTRRNRLGLKHRLGAWTEAENKVLYEYYSKIPAVEVSRMLPGRTRNAVVMHAESLGISGFKPYHEYNEKEEQFIIDNYLSMSDAEIGEMLGHPKESIKNRRNRLGCHRPKERSKYNDASEYFRKYNSEWKENSMRAGRYKCFVTGKRFDDIHHLMSLNKIIADACTYSEIDIDSFDPNYASDIEKRNFIDAVKSEQAKYPLGVCLSKDVHMQFHNKYGYGNNTPDQFYDFLNTFYPECSIC